MRSERDAVVGGGGGFFDCMTALEMRRRYRQVVLLEQDDDLLRRASYHNQAGVHGGYQYPRSLRTALRSRIKFPRYCSTIPNNTINTNAKYNKYIYCLDYFSFSFIRVIRVIRGGSVFCLFRKEPS